SPIPPLPPVMTATRPERSKMLMRRFPYLYDARQMSVPSMDKPAPKIKYAFKPELIYPRYGQRGAHEKRGNDAIQILHDRDRRTGRRAPARSSGGHERGLDGDAGRPLRGARCNRGPQG